MYSFFRHHFRHHYFQHNWYNLELLRLLGSSPYGGCDAAEFFKAVDQIKPNSAASWESTFLALAEAAEVIARDSEANGLHSSALSAYLRASNYYRCAQFMYPAAPDSQQAHFLELYERSIAVFDAATQFLGHPIYRVSIPHVTPQGKTVALPGRLYLPADAHKLPGRKTPLIISIGGADTTQEELYFMHVAEGPKLGFAILTFDGPGQGHVLRRDKVYMRPDYEEVIPGVLNWITQWASDNPDANLDIDAISLVGESLGAFLALRAAVDPRVKVVVAIDAFYDMWDLATARMPPWMMKLWEKQFIIRDSFIDWSARAHGKADIATRYAWGLATGMFGIPSGADALRNMKKYTFKLDPQQKVTTERSPNGNTKEKDGDYLARIHCPVLISGAAAEKDSFAPLSATEALHRGLRHLEEDDMELWVARSFADGGGQGKIGAWSLLQYRVYKFLDKKLGIDRNRDGCDTTDEKGDANDPATVT